MRNREAGRNGPHPTPFTVGGSPRTHAEVIAEAREYGLPPRFAHQITDEYSLASYRDAFRVNPPAPNPEVQAFLATLTPGDRLRMLWDTSERALVHLAQSIHAVRG